MDICPSLRRSNSLYHRNCDHHTFRRGNGFRVSQTNRYHWMDRRDRCPCAMRAFLSSDRSYRERIKNKIRRIRKGTITSGLPPRRERAKSEFGRIYRMYRKATLNDCEKVYHLICNMERKQLPFDRFYLIYQEQINNRHYYCLVCEYDNNVIGVLNLRFEEQLHHSACIAEIMEFAVDEAYRKQGVGKGMLANACQIAKDFGCMQIEVACNQLRKDTHRFYLREGMHNFHFKFSKSLNGNDTEENIIGK